MGSQRTETSTRRAFACAALGSVIFRMPFLSPALALAGSTSAGSGTVRWKAP
jgi:hypothetical protein